ncbi:unnamed protein product, partial [marine sediment metagenome]
NLCDKIRKASKATVIFDPSPAKLVSKIIRQLQKE